MFEPVTPVFLKSILDYLKTNNHLYQDVVINTENISLDGSACTSYDHLGTSKQIHEVTSNCKSLSSEILNTPVIPIILQCGETLEKAIENFEVISNFEDLDQHISTPIPIILEPIYELEEAENLAGHSSSATETCLVSTCPQINVSSECIDIAPGEGKLPKSILNDGYCEELSFFHLFPTGKFGCKNRRKIPLSPVKYFNQRLLSYSQKFASDTDYIFFARNILQSLGLKEQINIATRKVSGVSLNAGVLNNSCFNETVKQWISNDQAFRFMSSIKGTPSYWEKFKSEVLAMVKQLGVPQHFLSRYHVQIFGGRNFFR